jgi:predicted Zn-dependent protease
VCWPVGGAVADNCRSNCSQDAAQQDVKTKTYCYECRRAPELLAAAATPAA